MQAFQDILLKAKKEEDTKRRGLQDFYNKVNGLLNDMPEEDFSSLQKQLGDIKKNMKVHMDQLKEKDKFLLVTGKVRGRIVTKFSSLVP